METRPFDPADYLDTEEAIAAYLADARDEGDAITLARAEAVAARARVLNSHRPRAPRPATGRS